LSTAAATRASRSICQAGPMPSKKGFTWVRVIPASLSRQDAQGRFLLHSYFAWLRAPSRLANTATASASSAGIQIAGLGSGAGVIELYAAGQAPGEPGSGPEAGYGSSPVKNNSGVAPWPTTYYVGQLIALDPAGALYSLIGSGNLRQVTPAQETGGLGWGTSN
jgi:hypothetical protein